MRFRIIGPGRAGGAFAAALTAVGWRLDATYARADNPAHAASGVPLLMICVPDGAVASVSRAVEPGEAAVVHIAGSLGLDVLAGHERNGSIHPLMTLPDPERGAARLLDGCHFAIAGDGVTAAIAEALNGRAFSIDDGNRALYHAAAAVASNHLVALAGQVARLANAAGVRPESYWPLMTASLTNVAESNPKSALTGPAARADWETVRRHLAALDSFAGADDESSGGPVGGQIDRTLYLTLAAEAARLAGHDVPQDL